jgi:hypothetical protein
MANKPTVDARPVNPAATKPLTVQMVDALLDGASAIAKAALRTGIVAADKAVNKTREVVVAVERKVEAAAKTAPSGKIIVRKTPGGSRAVAKRAASKKAPSKKSAVKKAAAKKTSRMSSAAKATTKTSKKR